jgi:DUF4097 and DUF4098 domain-containing protein YvlB
MRRLFNVLAAMTFVGLATVAVAAADDFQMTYRIGAGGSISIKNVSGNIVVTGYDGDAITVIGRREGEDAHLVEVEDLSSSGSIDLRVRYPRNCRCNASINFEVRVPNSVKYLFRELSSASGNVAVRDVTGDVSARSASGEVDVNRVRGPVDARSASGNVHVGDVAGTVSGHSASGNVDVTITSLDEGGDMEFESASGNVDVRLPANVDADVAMSTLSGDIDTDFGLEIQESKFGPGKKARGRVGSGAHSLRLASVSGNVSLRKQ